MGRRADWQGQRAALRAACGVQWAAGGVQQAAGGSSNIGDSNAQAVAACGDVWLFSSCSDSIVLFDIGYSTLLFLCREHLKR
jgi:hypothetical protein